MRLDSQAETLQSVQDMRVRGGSCSSRLSQIETLKSREGEAREAQSRRLR